MSIITPSKVRELTHERFWSKIKFGEIDGCWEWQGAKNPDGYGWYSSGSGKEGLSHRAHRYLFIRLFGELDVKIFVCHHCDSPPCCNPNHLFTGTNRDNLLDCYRKGRMPNVHPLYEFVERTELKKGIAKGIAIGSRIGTSKLKEDEVKIIKKELAIGTPARILSRRFFVSDSAISEIKRGVTWRHILLSDPPSDYTYSTCADDDVRREHEMAMEESKIVDPEITYGNTN